MQSQLRSGGDPAPRRSKRLQDLIDAAALLESYPALASKLSPGEAALLEQLPK